VQEPITGYHQSLDLYADLADFFRGGAHVAGSILVRDTVDHYDSDPPNPTVIVNNFFSFTADSLGGGDFRSSMAPTNDG